MKKYKELIPRIITIWIYVPIIIIAFCLGSLPFFIMVLLSAFLATNEMQSMYKYKYKKDPDHFILSYVFSILLLTSAYMAEYKMIWEHPVFLIITLAALIFFISELVLKRVLLMDNSLFFTFRSILYIGLFYSYGILLRNIPNSAEIVWRASFDSLGLRYVLYLFSVIWINDIFAYLIGIPLGKHKLSPKVSPKKSIEGAVGALLGAVLMSIVLKDLVGISLLTAAMLGIVISFAAQTGDLIESLLKREFKVKDSGNFFPGHGGLLDRLDSVVLVLPLFFYYIKFFTK